jgi:hypothetical protein
MDGEHATGGVTNGATDRPTSPGDRRIPESEGVVERAGGPTADEVATLERVRALGRLLDDVIRVPGTDYRIGLDPILGILPVVGDLVAAVLSLYPVLEAYRLGVERRTIARMLALVLVDAGVGSVPVLGTVFDAFWKANEWNARTLERHVEGD